MAVLIFYETACKGCRLCMDACPKKILDLDTSKVNAKGYNPVMCNNIGDCTACAVCARVCPDSVIKVEKEVAV
jgi:2-oxoglutarate ferredoxin oxidoreductase subunit delta